MRTKFVGAVVVGAGLLIAAGASGQQATKPPLKKGGQPADTAVEKMENPLPIAKAGGVYVQAAAPVPMVTRTVSLMYLKPEQVVNLLAPYVSPYEHGPSMNAGVFPVSGVMAVTLRGSDKEVTEMESVLHQFDALPAKVELSFELITPDSTGQRDPGLAGLDTLLRGVLHYPGYMLAGQAIGSVSSGSTFMATITGPGMPAAVTRGVSYIAEPTISAIVRSVLTTSSGSTADLTVTLRSGMGTMISTDVDIPIGQTVVLGTSVDNYAHPILLVLRAKLVH